ncbi:MAG: hypothetical protein ACON4U_13280 [Myxococcota bacterium]
MIAFLLFSACNPEDATIKNAHWFSWLAANSSKVFIDDTMPYVDGSEEQPKGAPDVKIYECSGRGWDVELNEWEDGYIGPREGESGDQYIGGACSPEDTACDEAALQAQCEGINNATYHTFMQTDGFYLLNQEVSAWRSEAFINGEGHMQLTVHHDLPGEEDFRFSFVIDPDFMPTICTSTVEGDPAIQYVDGADWVNQWSINEEDGYTIYYLNAGAYQLNPSDQDDFWFLTTDWAAGFGHAKFSNEEFASAPAAYGNYDNGNDDFMFIDDRNAPDYDLYLEQTTALADLSLNTWEPEMTVANGASIDETPAFYHKIEDNSWRPFDSSNAGLDGWAELHTSWVRIKDPSQIKEGGKVEGDFQIYYIGTESNSRVLVSGEFKINELKYDQYSYPFFEDVKRAEEQGEEFCAGVSLGE